MTLEIRPITEDEIEQAELITAYSFNNRERRDPTLMTQAVERARKFYSRDWTLASFEDGEMTAFVRTIPFAIRINGRGLSFGAVGPVVSLPQHRRKGHVGAILRRDLEVMRERGQVLSGLHTPHPSLYRRYGWEIASVRHAIAFAPKDVELMAQPGERGRTRMLKADDWAVTDRVYRAHSAERNMALHRGEVWWREAIFGGGFSPEPADVACWEDGAGEPQGYAVYHQPNQVDEYTPPFFVRELVALTPDAYLNLLLYLLRHDLPKEIVYYTRPDDPFVSLVADQRKLKIAVDYDLMLRICDVPQALRQRPPAVERVAPFLLGISDSSAPWNEGTWRIETADGAVTVEEASGEADLSLSATTLAPVFNGFLSPSGAALAGLARARSDEALDAAEAFFATTHRPFCADGF